MKPKTPVDYLILALRVGLGLWFLVLGAEKVLKVGIPAFSRQVADLGLFQDPWNLAVAYLVPWLEISAGVCLIGSWWLRGAVRVLILLNLMFLFVTVQAWVRGLDADCGCFGSLFTLGHGGKLTLVLVHLVLLGLVVMTERHDGRRIFRVGGAKMRLPEV